MTTSIITSLEAPEATDAVGSRRTGRSWRVVLLGGVLLAGVVGGGVLWTQRGTEHTAPAAPPPPQVTVSQPLAATVAATTSFLGQFSAVDTVDLRAQVGGTLTKIAFEDGQIVHQGDLLFVIDPRPFQIRLDQATAQLATAQARRELAQAELWRAQQLRQTSFGTVEAVDQRNADQRAAEAAIATAQAAIRDAQLDLEFSRVPAPFTGRIGAHEVSVGSLVSGSRGGAGATTLLASVVSLDPIHLDFDMSEADFRAYARAHDGRGSEDVAIDLDGDGKSFVHGRLDFLNNAIDRSSGTIHARATVPNPDLAITPGQFARLRLATGRAAPALLLPPAALVPDQARQAVMTVAADGSVVPKYVETGGLYKGLRVIRGGLAADDQVIIGGLVRVRPGAMVHSVSGSIKLGADDNE